ncbi:MAG: glycosyltransferase [Planctomycetes bacterium]|nr:glycosyltransferase [Planctomycetota bacterium]
MPDLTLVVPLFNRPRTLARILRALDAQTLDRARFETVFVDDSGPENYGNQREVLEAAPLRCAWTLLSTGLPRGVNGVSVARNLAIRAARGEVVMFMDDDCVPHPEMLAAHLEAHRARPRLAAVGNRSEDESILAARPPLPLTFGKCAREEAKSARGGLGAGSFVTANASVKREHLLAAGLFDESFARAGEYGYEDKDLGKRLIELGLEIRFLRDAAVWMAPRESDPWEGRREAARNAARARYHRKHDVLIGFRSRVKDLLGIRSRRARRKGES